MNKKILFLSILTIFICISLNVVSATDIHTNDVNSLSLDNSTHTFRQNGVEFTISGEDYEKLLEWDKTKKLDVYYDYSIGEYNYEDNKYLDNNFKGYKVNDTANVVIKEYKKVKYYKTVKKPVYKYKKVKKYHYVYKYKLETKYRYSYYGDENTYYSSAWKTPKGYKYVGTYTKYYSNGWNFYIKYRTKKKVPYYKKVKYVHHYKKVKKAYYKEKLSKKSTVKCNVYAYINLVPINYDDLWYYGNPNGEWELIYHVELPSKYTINSKIIWEADMPNKLFGISRDPYTLDGFYTTLKI